MRAEIARLTAERDEARADVFAKIREVTDHALDNARALRVYGGESRREARCRALAALYLSEAAECVRLDDDLRRLDAQRERHDALIARVDAMLAEVHS